MAYHPDVHRIHLSLSANGNIETSAYAEHREYVLAVLGRRCHWLDASDREALFHDAYTLLLEKERQGAVDVGAMRPRQIRAYLTQTALNKAMDEGKRAGRRRSVPLEGEGVRLEPVDPGREPDEELITKFGAERVREIVAELPDRQRAIMILRFFFDQSPADVQRDLGISERVYRRELERASRRMAKRLELVRQGRFCETRRSLILAYVTGIAGPRRAAQARRHLASCPACASWVRELRGALGRAA
jgi:RNA polymerase sigma factor (sigma-70 family)